MKEHAACIPADRDEKLDKKCTKTAKLEWMTRARDLSGLVFHLVFGQGGRHMGCYKFDKARHKIRQEGF